MNAPIRGIGNGPKSVSCYICGRQYMVHSFAIHEKQCRELFEKREEVKLPRERKKCPSNPMLGIKLTGSKSDIDAYNAAAAETWTTSLSECQFCGRRFLPEKLAIHNRSCRADNPARSVNDNRSRTPAALETASGSSNTPRARFETNESSAIRPSSAHHRPSSSSNSKIEKSGGNYPSESNSGGPSIECSGCGRTFNSTAFATHTKICQKVFGGKRKVFDSAKARAKGTELAAYYQQNLKNAARGGGNVTNRPSAGRESAGMSRGGDSGYGGNTSGNSDLQAAYDLRDSNRARASFVSNTSSSSSQIQAMPKWKRDSLAFRQAMKAARAYDAETAASNTNSNTFMNSQPQRGNNAHVRGGVSHTSGNGLLRGAVENLSGNARPLTGDRGVGHGGSAVSSSRGGGGAAPFKSEYLPKIRCSPNGSKGGRPSSGNLTSKSLSRSTNTNPHLHQQVQREVFPDIDPSFLQCPHCSRSFNEKAGERHIPLCRGIVNKPSRLSRGSGVPAYSTNTPY